MTAITPHFSLEEFCASQTAARLGIDNSLPPALMPNAIKTCLGMERVRVLLNANAIHISSGYRCKALNDAVGSKDTSQHMTAQAVDFTSTFSKPQTIVRLIGGSSIKFDQLIWEYGDAGWVHISFSDNPRGQVLTIDKSGTRNFV